MAKTKLVKPVTREMLYSPNGRTIYATLEPGDEISFRAKGRRRTASVPLSHVMNLATIFQSMREHKEKMKEYERKKKAGYKNLRRPRQISLAMFNKFYHQAFKM